MRCVGSGLAIRGSTRDVFVEMPHRICSELAEIVATSRHVFIDFQLVRVSDRPKVFYFHPAYVKLLWCLSCTVCFVYWLRIALMLDQFC